MDQRPAGEHRPQFQSIEDAPELFPALPLLPAIAGRVDALDGHLRALTLRLDVLGSAMGAIRSAVGERIDGYADAAAAAARRADEAVEDLRRSTERSLAELRRGVDSHAEDLRRVGRQVDQISGQVAAALDAIRSGPTASDGEEIGKVTAAVEAVRAELAAVAAPVLDLSPVLVRFEALAAEVAAAVPAPVLDLSPVLVRLEALAAEVDVLSRPSLAPESPSPELDAVLGRISALEANLERVLALVETIVDVMPASAEGSGADLAERVADAVARRLEQR